MKDRISQARGFEDLEDIVGEWNGEKDFEEVAAAISARQEYEEPWTYDLYSIVTHTPPEPRANPVPETLQTPLSPVNMRLMTLPAGVTGIYVGTPTPTQLQLKV